MKNTATVCGPVRRQTALMVGVFLSALLTASHANAEEMIKNQGFEGADCTPGVGQGCLPWTFKPNTAVNDEEHSGNKGATVGGLGSGPGMLTQAIMFRAGTYNFSFWYKATSGDAGLTPAIVRIAGRTVFAEILKPGTDWRLYQMSVQVDNDGPATIEISSERPPHYAGPSFQIDDVSLKE
ncbi:hypothetical protein GOB14_11885 [Sinorhizobium meliloti]|nr:hypothetical protein [Sinorhizobium meliloti]